MIQRTQTLFSLFSIVSLVFLVGLYAPVVADSDNGTYDCGYGVNLTNWTLHWVPVSVQRIFCPRESSNCNEKSSEKSSDNNLKKRCTLIKQKIDILLKGKKDADKSERTTAFKRLSQIDSDDSSSFNCSSVNSSNVEAYFKKEERLPNEIEVLSNFYTGNKCNSYCDSSSALHCYALVALFDLEKDLKAEPSKCPMAISPTATLFSTIISYSITATNCPACASFTVAPSKLPNYSSSSAATGIHTAAALNTTAVLPTPTPSENTTENTTATPTPSTTANPTEENIIASSSTSTGIYVVVLLVLLVVCGAFYVAYYYKDKIRSYWSGGPKGRKSRPKKKGYSKVKLASVRDALP